MAERVDTPAIVIQRFPFGESSQVAHLLTEKLGRVAILARGAWRERNGYEGPLDLLVRGRVTLSLVQGRELGLLLRRRVETSYPALRRDLARFTAASHLLRQVLAWEPVGAGPGETYFLLDRALEALERAPPDRIALLVLAFDLKMARAHGFLPQVSSCVRCGSPRSLARLVIGEGGVVCTGCLERRDEGERLDGPTAELLRALAAEPLSRVASPAAATLSRARRLVDLHLQWHAGAEKSGRRPDGAGRGGRARGNERLAAPRRIGRRG